jgi:Flp pilus assembly protein TadG
MKIHRDDQASSDDRGAIIVEFALIVPILVVLLVGIINFGQAYNTQIAVQGAAREGARALALGNSAVDAVDASGVDAIAVSSQSGCPDGATDAYATVTTSKDFTFRIPFLSIGTRTLTATASMRCGL